MQVVDAVRKLLCFLVGSKTTLPSRCRGNHSGPSLLTHQDRRPNWSLLSIGVIPARSADPNDSAECAQELNRSLRKFPRTLSYSLLRCAHFRASNPPYSHLPPRTTHSVIILSPLLSTSPPSLFGWRLRVRATFLLMRLVEVAREQWYAT